MVVLFPLPNLQQVRPLNLQLEGPLNLLLVWLLNLQWVEHLGLHQVNLQDLQQASLLSLHQPLLPRLQVKSRYLQHSSSKDPLFKDVLHHLAADHLLNRLSQQLPTVSP